MVIALRQLCALQEAALGFLAQVHYWVLALANTADRAGHKHTKIGLTQLIASIWIIDSWEANS